MSDTKPFVQKLYTMVDDPSTSDIIGWTDDGAAFEVLKLEPFTQGQLPTYFKHGNLSSFVRQLNTYGFSKVDANAWVFSHPDFVRGGGDRLGRIQRKSSHRPAAAAASDELPMPDDGMDQLVPLTGGFADTSSSATGVQPAASAAEVASMRRRIELLNQEVSQARAQQADTRASIGKIMEFLSQMYREQRRANAGMSAAAGVGSIPTAPMLPQLPAPPLPHAQPQRPSSAERVVTEPDAPAGGGARRSKRQRTETVKFDADKPKPQQQPPPQAQHEEPTPFLHLGGGGPTLSRQSSLGAQVASALPIDLRELALELAGSTELQDRTLQDIRSGGGGVSLSRGNSIVNGGGGGFVEIQDLGEASQGSGLGEVEENGGVPDDVDAYLWDFIETSQDLATEADNNKAKA